MEVVGTVLESSIDKYIGRSKWYKVCFGGFLSLEQLCTPPPPDILKNISNNVSLLVTQDAYITLWLVHIQFVGHNFCTGQLALSSSMLRVSFQAGMEITEQNLLCS